MNKTFQFLTFIAAITFARVNACELVFRDDPTANLIAYLDRIMTEFQFTPNQIKILRTNLKLNRIVLSSLESSESVHPYLRIHLDAIHNMTAENSIDFPTIAKWLNAKQKLVLRESDQKKTAKEKTSNPDYPIRFNRLRPGSFSFPVYAREPMAPKKNRMITIELTHSIEMMDAPVTNKQWFDLAFSADDVFFKDAKFVLEPDHPIDAISWYSALVFANKMSEKHNLPPVYDLSHIPFNEFFGKFDDGTLSAAGWFVPKINAPGGNIYLAKGFRLPTLAEASWVRFDRNENKFFILTDVASTADYVFSNNKHSSRHLEVRHLLPQMKQGMLYYDLHGKNGEWTNDSEVSLYELNRFEMVENPSLHGLINPLFMNVHQAVYDSMFTTQLLMKCSSRGDRKAVGLRLVRTLSKGERVTRE